MARRKRGKGARLPPGTLNTATAAWVAGMHPRTLQRWVERRAIHPPNVGTESWRVLAWDLQALTAAWAVAKLRRLGVSAQRVRKAVEVISRTGIDITRARLATDGRNVFEVLPEGEKLRDLTGSEGQTILYPLHAWAEEIRTVAEAKGYRLRKRVEAAPPVGVEGKV